MHILTANLKHLYQKIIVFLWHAIFIVTAVVILCFVERGEVVSGFAFLLLWIFLAAVIPTVLTLETLILPFSFCLPGHRRIPQKVAFTIAPTISLVWSLVFGGAFGLRFLDASFWAVFVLLSTAYLLSAWLVFRFSSKFVTLFMLLFVVIMGGIYFYNGLHTIPYLAITHYPVLVIVLGSSVAVVLYKRMGDETIVRRYNNAGCRSAIAGGLFNDISAKQSVKQTAPLSRFGRSIEEFLIRRISNCPDNSIEKYIWGVFYGPFSIRVEAWMNWNTIAYLVLMLLLYGYLSSCNQLIWSFLWIGWIAANKSGLVANVFSPHLFAGGRRERFYTVGVLTLGVCLILSSAILLIAPITQVLSPILSPIKERTFEPMNPLFAIVPWFYIPLSEGLYLLFSRRLAISWCRMILFWLILIGTIPFIEGDITVGPTLVVSVVMLSWAFFIRILWRTARYECLV